MKTILLVFTNWPVFIKKNRQVDEVLTDDILLWHPRALLVLAAIQLVLALQLLIFGMIGVIYGASPYLTVLWVGIKAF